MSQDGMYYKLKEEYHQLNKKKRELMRERDDINAKLEMIEDILVGLDDILCKFGKHIYEHFEERDQQESEEEQ